MKYMLVSIQLLIIWNLNIAKSQDTLSYKRNFSYEVIQCGCYPSNDSDESIFQRFLRILFGTENEKLYKPFSITQDDAKNIWITDQGISSIIKIKDNQFYTPRFLSRDKTYFPSLIDICSFTNGRILFTDSKLNKIYLSDEKNKMITEFSLGHALNRPTGIAYSSVNHEVYVSETGAHVISVFNEEGKFLRNIGRRGYNFGEFNFPTFIYVDKLGIIYVIDSMNFRIQLFDKNGEFLRAFGEHGNGSGYFAAPKGIAVDSKGNIFVADALFHAVQVFNKNGDFLESFGSQGNETGQFWMPTGIYIDDNDVIYVADSYNSRIQLFKLVPKKKENE